MGSINIDAGQGHPLFDGLPVGSRRINCLVTTRALLYQRAWLVYVWTSPPTSIKALICDSAE